MSTLTGTAKTVIGVAALGAAAGIGIVATQSSGTLCYGVNPVTGQAECTSKLMRECPQPWMRVVEVCPVLSGTGGDIPPDPTAPPVPTEPAEPTPAASPTSGPGPTPVPTTAPTPRPPTATPTAPPAPSCEPVRIVRWANVSPEPVGVTLTAQAGDRGGELWTPAGKRVLLPRERVQITAAGGIAIGAGLVELRGTAVQVVGDREVPSTLPGELLWPCEAK